MKYKTKPFEVEAVEFDGNNWEELEKFVGSRPAHATIDGEEVYIVNFQRAGSYVAWDDEAIVAEVYDYIHSSWVGVRKGDFIIKGSKEEFYPCDPEVFHSKYEPKFATGGVVMRSKNGNWLVSENGHAEFKDLTVDNKE